MNTNHGFDKMKPHELSADSLSKLNDIRDLLVARRFTSGLEELTWKPFIGNEPEDEMESGVIIVGNPEALSETDMMLTQSQGFYSLGSQSQSENPFQFQTQAVSNTRILQDELNDLNEGNQEELTTAALNTFVASNPSKLSSLCEELKIHELSDSTIDSLFTEILNLDKEPSLNWCCAFIDYYFAEKVINLNSFASRNLKNVITNFCRRFPRATVDHLMVPVTYCDKFGINQLDVISSLFKDCLPSEHQVHLLRQVLERQHQWNDSTISLMTAILDAKLTFGEDVLNVFAQRLLDSTELLQKNVKNVKFGKFLKQFITQYLREFTPAQYEALTSVVDQHKTFYQRGCLQLLKKIRP